MARGVPDTPRLSEPVPSAPPAIELTTLSSLIGMESCTGAHE